MKKKNCFKCGKLTSTTIQTKEKKGLTFICNEESCWKAYYKSL